MTLVKQKYFLHFVKIKMEKELLLNSYDKVAEDIRKVVLAIVNEQITKPDGMHEVSRLGEEFLVKFSKFK